MSSTDSNGRITNIEPLPDDVLDQIYLQPDFDPDVTKKFIQAQSFDSVNDAGPA
ncbi:MAG: hypothetical protein ACXW32_06955 [Limisphaerales bacterium]